ncbi:unnamed protein product [Microthlaspi erraticum]|uniref:PB1-like domain-containing protein n=1 Tax=Microthlaspi erraticum TaxID=1685480 RepID=A0A6D2HSW6_9BRAS|nr:unnamed protein product [Microthlaspi erraticum]
MSDSETIKVNLYQGGLVEYKDKTFTYNGGSVKEGIVIDLDFMTWSMFDAFCEDNKLGGGLVEHTWYKLPQEDIGLVRPIFERTSDEEIHKMCMLAKTVGGVNIFIEKSVLASGENEGAKDEGEECDDNAPENADGNQAEGEEVVEDGKYDIRFQAFRDELGK